MNNCLASQLCGGGDTAYTRTQCQNVSAWHHTMAGMSHVRTDFGVFGLAFSSVDGHITCAVFCRMTSARSWMVTSSARGSSDNGSPMSSSAPTDTFSDPCKHVDWRHVQTVVCPSEMHGVKLTFINTVTDDNDRKHRRASEVHTNVGGYQVRDISRQ